MTANRPLGRKNNNHAPTRPSTDRTPHAGARPRQHDVRLALQQPASASASGILQVQRTAGNRAVHRLLASQGIQASLRVGPANDPIERQAERVAQQVTGPGRGAAPGLDETPALTNSVAAPEPQRGRQPRRL